MAPWNQIRIEVKSWIRIHSSEGMTDLISYETDKVQGVGVAATQQAQGQRGNLKYLGKIQLLTKIGILKDGVVRYASKVPF
jgi:hypothetical protein